MNEIKDYTFAKRPSFTSSQTNESSQIAENPQDLPVKQWGKQQWTLNKNTQQPRRKKWVFKIIAQNIKENGKDWIFTAQNTSKLDIDRAREKQKKGDFLDVSLFLFYVLLAKPKNT